MSTPTTATATHPQSHYHYGAPFSHPHQHQQYHSTSTGQYVLPAPAATTRLPPIKNLHAPKPASGHPSPHGPPVTLSSGTSATLSTPRSEYTSTVMPSTTQTATITRPEEMDAAGPRKRRRSKGPDWDNFYKNGLPREVIVIDDDSEPEVLSQSTAPGSARTIINGHATRANGNGHAYMNGAPANSRSQHTAKRRRRDGEPSAHYDPVHNRVVGSHTNTPASTISSDRTTSAIATTAPTSLGSSSSNGHYEDANAGQKRKRTTRQQAGQAKRREAALYGDAAYTNYQPPAKPIKKAPEVSVRVVHDPNLKNLKVDDEDGHYIIVPDAELTEDYQMIKLLGQGTFGKVVQARDRRRNELVAIKIIRSVQKYRDASRIELRVLQTLKLNDQENRNRCIHLRDTFDFRGHICIVMDLLGQSVFDFLKSNQFTPFPNSQIQSFARQLFTSVAFLHDLNLIHTDLKPENILLADATYQTFTYNRKIPSSSTTVGRTATQRKVLLDTEIRLIDFGSATFQDEYHSSVVSTRHYRAPEIILGLGWSFPCDIWSIGCILVEFFTGDALFQTHDNLEHLAMMEAVVDRKIDTHLVQQVHRNTRSGPNPATKYFKRSRLDFPSVDTQRASKKYVKAMKKLPDIIPCQNTFMKQFLDLLTKIFVYDPARRITAKEALQHPWFREVAHPDDGSEAARIRAERMSKNELHTRQSERQD
ncbi:hypothetical protein MCOR25_003423 [Pyricularia grisea]|uniref:dual-specificity kinase n=1 Tax=Pyricularia grisea TaxID=148305 RepID=A0A6P8ARG9_PYRGI|nr:uncharacterized protein PgNI_09404 [Pyricularia grisea]KAI6373651.1 hypothetical protein MCOR25_003423 [Pyricularia grisea]TLD04692.1 hypothetical protein PgNI_09404 [Pyricularia grisea]